MNARILIGALCLCLAVEAMAEDKPAVAPVAAKAAAAKTAAPAKDTPPPPADDKTPEYTTITLQGLNKVTGHISQLGGPLGTVLRFGNLEIIGHRCWKSAPEDRPENAALLEIRELKPDESPQKIFLGWMFSSSPGLSGLEHPVYDITVLSCDVTHEPDAKPEAKEPEKKDAPKKEKEAAKP